MHILTKTLVVIAAVLAVVLSSLSMAYSVNADRLAQGYEDIKRERDAVQATAEADKTRNEAAMNRARESNIELQNEINRLKTEIRGLAAENTQLQIKANAISKAEDDFRNEVQRWEAMIQTQTQLIESYRDEVTQLRDNELQSRRREIELVDRINDLESIREVQEQSIRALTEQLAEAQDRIRVIAAGGGAAAEEEGVGQMMGRPVYGSVQKVMMDTASGKPLAQIDLGSNDGVRENTKLYIGRGDQFIAHLVITRVDLNWSIGEIDTLGRKVEVRPGDFVTSVLGAG